ncbi:hypothetical protein PMIN06_011930 [Paraphaeosphaeria minitans]
MGARVEPSGLAMEFCWNAREPSAADTNAAAYAAPHPTPSRRQHPQRRTLPDQGLIQVQISAYIVYMPTYRVLCCKVHRTGIENLDTHLLRKHGVPIEERKKFIESCAHYRIRKPKKLKAPPPGGPPIEVLGEPRDGVQCTQPACSFVTPSKDSLRIHCNKKHGLPFKLGSATLYRPVKLQSFFPASGPDRYFIVDVTKRNAEPTDSHIAASHSTRRRRWFKRTGWLEHLAKRNPMHLAHQTRLPDRDEHRLRQAAKLVELLVERSVKGLSTLARETRRWLRSAKRQEADQRPMARLQNPESQACYASYIIRFVCYYLRVIADEEKGRDSSSDKRQRQHRKRWGRRQRSKLVRGKQRQ